MIDYKYFLGKKSKTEEVEEEEVPLTGNLTWMV